jgi:hypothetical protein
LWTGVFIAGLLTLLIKILPPFFQQNQPTLALVMPVAFVLSGLGGRLRFFKNNKTSCEEPGTK